MTIKKRLVLSNIAMIVIPVLAFFLMEIIMGYIFFVLFNGRTDDNQLNLFLSLRFVSVLVVLIITNGLLTFFVARSIIKPIQQLAAAAKEIEKGNLHSAVTIKGQDEISQLATSFEAMRKKLQATEALNVQYETNRKELITNISHDLKTPITSIKGYVDGIRDGVANTPEKTDKYMETISIKANELDHLIDELFMYSKLNLQNAPYYYEKIDLKEYLQDYLEELRFDMEERGGSVRLHVENSDHYFVHVDREKFNRVITNVIENSLKYMDKDKQAIDLMLTDEQEYVTLQIKDNGSGINQDLLTHIFEQFYRTDASRNSATGGSGIGLSIVKQIVDGHGGNVWAESEVGIGTSVFVVLPKAGEEI